MRVILDTNVLVSGLISEIGPPARIVDAVSRCEIIPVMSPATFAGLEEILHRSELQRYFRRAGVTAFQFLTVLRQVAQLVRPRASIAPIRDEKDRPFLELAASRPAADYLVTGDKDFENQHYEDIPVISESLFVEKVLNPK